MPGLFDPTTVTFNGEEVKSLSEAIFVKGFEKPEINSFHKVVTGIVAKKQIAILGLLESKVGKGRGECDPESNDTQFASSQKFWDPEVVSDRLTQCWKDLRKSFWEWGLAKGIKKPDLTGGDFFNYVKEVLMDAFWEMVYRIVWFNDKTAENVVDGGVITNGEDLDFFNLIDGLWKQIFAIVAANPSRKTNTILTTRNAGASYALQQFTTADTTNLVVSKALMDTRLGADYRLRKMPNTIFVATQSVVDQYERELTFAKIAFDTDRLENGITVFKSGGRTIYGFDFWDRTIEESYDNGTTHFLPHRLVYVTDDNLQVGLEEESNLSEFDVHHDKTTKKNHIDFQISIDAKVALDHLIQVSY